MSGETLTPEVDRYVFLPGVITLIIFMLIFAGCQYFYREDLHHQMVEHSKDIKIFCSENTKEQTRLLKDFKLVAQRHVAELETYRQGFDPELVWRAKIHEKLNRYDEALHIHGN